MKCWLFCIISLLVSVQGFSGEIDLSVYEKSLYSRYGEDGVLAKLFQLLAPSKKFYVALGAGDGISSNPTILLRKLTWEGLSFDKGHSMPAINLFKAFITADNVNALLDEHAVPYDFAFLSIDLGYNDFHIWHAIDEKYKPSVVVIGYNGMHLSTEDKVVRYRPFYCGDGSNYYGASILALYNLGRLKGYSLVYADQSGAVLFFVRDEVLDKHDIQFLHKNDVDQIYRVPRYGTGPTEGYFQDSKNWPYFSSECFLKDPGCK